MEETTLVLIKPKGVQQGLLPEITSRLVTQSGLKLVAVKTVLDIDGVQQKWNEVNFKVDRNSFISGAYNKPSVTTQ